MITPARQAQLGLFATGVVLVSCLAVLGLRAAERQLDAAGGVLQFELADIDGGLVSTGSLRGRVTVLAFGSIACPGSNAYGDRIIGLAQQYQDSHDVEVYMVEVGGRQGNPSLAELRVHRNVTGQPFPTLLDPGGRTAAALGVAEVPSVVVVDQRGRVRYRGPFDDNRDERLVRRSYCADVVRTLLGETGEPVVFTQAFGRVFPPK
jgi:peroxiredoxin